MGEIWIWCADLQAQFQKEYASLIAKARQLAEGRSVCAVVASKVSPAGEECLAAADRILWFPAEGSCLYQGELLAELARQRQPEIILLTATLQGAQVASRVAARLEAGLSADCTDLWMDGGLLVMHRPAFGGGVEADILCPNAKPQMATVRPGVFSHVTAAGAAAELVQLPLPRVAEDPIVLLETTLAQVSENFTDAKIIVAGGLGVGSKENFAILQELADLLGGQVGASRAAVDAGYASWTRQIGQTGKTVHPAVYIAFGISGSIQHIMGMNGSEFVISVNSDPKAPIFSYSDVAIVADWKTTAEEMILKLKK